jgi:uncharacterized protein (DUF1330 family)
MTAYLLARVEITDWDRYKEYVQETPGVVKKYGGKFIARGGKVETLEGTEEKRRLVLIWRVSPHRLHFMSHHIVYTLYNFQIMKGDYTMAKKNNLIMIKKFNFANNVIN